MLNADEHMKQKALYQFWFEWLHIGCEQALWSRIGRRESGKKREEWRQPKPQPHSSLSHFTFCSSFSALPAVVGACWQSRLHTKISSSDDWIRSSIVEYLKSFLRLTFMQINFQTNLVLDLLTFPSHGKVYIRAKWPIRPEHIPV